jgi:hypothetical protein
MLFAPPGKRYNEEKIRMISKTRCSVRIRWIGEEIYAGREP